jgi:hypothetical protein
MARYLYTGELPNNIDRNQGDIYSETEIQNIAAEILNSSIDKVVEFLGAEKLLDNQQDGLKRSKKRHSRSKKRHSRSKKRQSRSKKRHSRSKKRHSRKNLR